MPSDSVQSQPNTAEAACTHTNQFRGKDAPCPLGGSYKTAVCADCGAFQTHSHIDRNDRLSAWRPASEYEARTSDDEDF